MSVFVAIVAVVAAIVAFYLVCGYLDIKRNDRLTKEVVRKYFRGGGRTTWHMSPFNLFVDLLCYGNRYIYRLEDLPEDCQRELKDLFDTFHRKQNYLLQELGEKTRDKKKAMIFFKWYGKNVDNPLPIEEFQREFKYIKTIGISIFNQRQSTTAHFGPLRLTLRVLYNLTPIDEDSVYIQVGRRKHVWFNDPLFIFDDTLIHQSFNESDKPRYCVFVDIIRPSLAHNTLSFLVDVVHKVFVNFNRIFYKHWEFIN